MSFVDDFRNKAVKNAEKAEETISKGGSVMLAQHYREMAHIYALLYQGARG